MNRFWSKVERSGGPESCWLWTAALHEAGYGMFGVEGNRTDVAHRVAWRISRGPIPRGMHVLHRCDTPGCVNPDHLFLGTNLDNVRDKQAKGRQLRGSEIGNSKLVVEDVLHIRGLAGEGRSFAEIARALGVSAKTGLDDREAAAVELVVRSGSIEVVRQLRETTGKRHPTGRPWEIDELARIGMGRRAAAAEEVVS